MNSDDALPRNFERNMTDNSGYMAEQQQELSLGKEEGLDVSAYASPDFNWLQMEQIRMGLKDKLDVSAYADSSYSHETMKQIRLSMYSGKDLTPWIARGFVDDELEQIRLALEDDLLIDTWITDDMYMQQIHEIRIGGNPGFRLRRLEIQLDADAGNPPRAREKAERFPLLKQPLQPLADEGDPARS